MFKFEISDSEVLIPYSLAVKLDLQSQGTQDGW